MRKILGSKLVLTTTSGEQVHLTLPDGVHPEDLKIATCTDGFDWAYIYDTDDEYEEQASIIATKLENMKQHYEEDELVDAMLSYIEDKTGVENCLNDPTNEDVQSILTHIIKLAPRICYSNQVDLNLIREIHSLLVEDITTGGFVGLFNSYNESLARRVYQRMWAR